jgi:hypothetical protein
MNTKIKYGNYQRWSLLQCPHQQYHHMLIWVLTFHFHTCFPIEVESTQTSPIGRGKRGAVPHNNLPIYFLKVLGKMHFCQFKFGLFCYLFPKLILSMVVADEKRGKKCLFFICSIPKASGRIFYCLVIFLFSNSYSCLPLVECGVLAQSVFGYVNYCFTLENGV